MKIPKETDLLVWNIPYLDPISDANDTSSRVGEGALSDIPDWAGVGIVESYHRGARFSFTRLTILLLLRTSPKSLSKISDWKTMVGHVAH